MCNCNNFINVFVAAYEVFLNPPFLNSEEWNLVKALDVFYTHAQHCAQIKVCGTKWHVFIVSHWNRCEENMKIYWLSNHSNPLWFVKKVATVVLQSAQLQLCESDFK